MVRNVWNNVDYVNWITVHTVNVLLLLPAQIAAVRQVKHCLLMVNRALMLVLIILQLFKYHNQLNVFVMIHLHVMKIPVCVKEF